MASQIFAVMCIKNQNWLVFNQLKSWVSHMGTEYCQSQPLLLKSFYFLTPILPFMFRVVAIVGRPRARLAAVVVHSVRLLDRILCQGAAHLVRHGERILCWGWLPRYTVQRFMLGRFRNVECRSIWVSWYTRLWNGWLKNHKINLFCAL